MIITPSTLETATPRLAELLDEWAPYSQLPREPGTLRLIGPNGHTIGAKTRVDGTTLQLWITAPGTKPEERPKGIKPLPPGHSYHTVLQLGGLDGDLGETIHAAFADRLLPTITMKPRYIGERPWERHLAPAAVEPESVTDAPAAVEPESVTDAPAAGKSTPRSGIPNQARPARKAAAKKTTAPAADAKPVRTRKAAAKKTTAPAADAKPVRTRKAAAKKTTAAETA
ncbi:hypothetical protein [Kitasatospora cineracea]|uniref:hypothetical protein n=1 Tax=Kitasatospora cineracea TaxID=88074 RepID=UPI00367B5131